tara:strand:- start:825 stop:1334 length:510 start_codon:yes stop_codon:yes gene_type:complete
MSEYFAKTKKAMKEVFQNKSYILMALTFGLFIFLFNGLVTNYQYLLKNLSPSVWFGFVIGTFTSIAASALILLLITSALAGIVFAMSVYVIKRQIKSGIATGTSSIFLSVIAPSCPACAFGFLSVIGLGSFLTVLPFKGLELGVFAIIILGASILYLSGKINTKVCRIK